MFMVNNLTGFGAGGVADVAIVGTVTGNTSTGDTVTHAVGNIDVGTSSGDKNIILGFTWEDSAERTISSASVGGVSLAAKGAQNTGSSRWLSAAIWTGDISSISGSQAISVTFSTNVLNVGVSGVAVTGLQSLTPTMTDGDFTTSAAQMIGESLAAGSGGIAIAFGGSENNGSTATWGSLTERADVQTGGGGSDHRHTAAWDLGFHAAANETLDFTAGNARAMMVAGFR